METLVIKLSVMKLFCDEVFSGRHSRQFYYKLKRFGEQLHLHPQGDVM